MNLLANSMSQQLMLPHYNQLQQLVPLPVHNQQRNHQQQLIPLQVHSQQHNHQQFGSWFLHALCFSLRLKQEPLELVAKVDQCIKNGKATAN